ncbi:hypothetical protein [Nocardioides pelophilus]|uniref:hypothetical protein n=1 Tax=Nocardioides pelophilus TaxID=2172019 RepID=UPI00160416D5|nr:hypothetical protein [Nocardioides pelophilus]
MGIYRTQIDANRNAVRALAAAHRCPELGGRTLEGRKLASRELFGSLEPPG